ncbi:membrane-bound lytic murein transglycosylase A [Pseudacidovorax intermedius]|uniref:peptidoglycan lytic exotransglycosylase n=1 Tax=Pseudacidovorax intermedius TaxID=433924 RepID=A0A370FP18_9BURK|nr:MltA domain-containing protein [Pseudacidovorax intermedius]RDI29477.1 membrane-bound lytic murein transglycosylase A [Pseudacidovorax intermedius]
MQALAPIPPSREARAPGGGPRAASLAGTAALTLAALLAAGCATPPPPPPPPPAPVAAPQPPIVLAPPAPPPVAVPAPPPRTGGSVAGQARTFSTQLATYTATPFDVVPGWQRDDFVDSWSAFLDSCKVLVRRGQQWQQVCARARQVDGASNPAIRSFYESEFAAYQIRDDDRRPDGVVTGYFEPEIEGNRSYSPPFIYPVYAQPEDMLFLDTRRLPAGNGTVAARLNGRNVVVQTGLSTRDMGAPGLYALDLSQIVRDTVDRKARLRVEGRQLVPYYTRAEIERLGVPNAKVLAFVRSATELYEMQVQGSGRIRLPDGQTVRVGYAEQNGQPFRPTLAKAANGKAKTAVRTRGSAVELEVDDDDADETDTSTVRTRGFALALPARSGPVAVPGQRTPAAAATGTGIQDPSYVFFKEVPTSADGPVGALGVPLQPGRSIAVDPRSAPLGFPVFVSTRQPGTGTPMQRLTIAQDTGGAIRGAVRADYFFGNGRQAANQARRMKERGQLWLLLPRGLTVAAATTGGGSVRTRGASLANCVVPDDDTCADDQ